MLQRQPREVKVKRVSAGLWCPVFCYCAVVGYSQALLIRRVSIHMSLCRMSFVACMCYMIQIRWESQGWDSCRWFRVWWRQQLNQKLDSFPTVPVRLRCNSCTVWQRLQWVTEVASVPSPTVQSKLPCGSGHSDYDHVLCMPSIGKMVPNTSCVARYIYTLHYTQIS